MAHDQDAPALVVSVSWTFPWQAMPPTSSTMKWNSPSSCRWIYVGVSHW